MSTELRNLLQSMVFTRDVEPRRLDDLVAFSTIVDWEPARKIFREGDVEPSLYLVIDGCVALEIAVPGRGHVRILTVGPGEVFGWSSIYYDKPKTAAATAVEKTRAVKFDAAKLRELSDSDSQFGYWLTRQLLQVVSERLKATRVQLLDIFGS